jgi:hypothetical protein
MSTEPASPAPTRRGSMDPVWVISVIAVVIVAVIAWRTFGRR